MSGPQSSPTLVPGMPDGAPPREGGRRRLGGTGKALVAVAVLLVVLGGAAFGGLWWFQRQLEDNVEKLGDPFAAVTDRPEPAPSEPGAELTDVNLLVLGSDSRISAGDPSQWEAGAQRTDAVMLVHLPADRESAVVVSIPRDAWVPVPGHGYAKVNAAFSYGGPALMIQTVEDLTGVRIDHFVVTDFESFTAMTDALGGVRIRVPQDIGDGDEVFFTAGVHQMSGEEALAYTRQRHGLANGDFGRVQRQQNWMRAMLGKINNNRGDVVAMARLYETVSRSVAADDELTMARMRELFESAREVSTNEVAFLTAPHQGTGESADGQSIVVLDEDRFAALMTAIADGEAARYVQEHEDDLDLLPATVK